MKITNFLRVGIAAFVLAMVLLPAVPVKAQTPVTSPVFTGLQNALDLNNTNSLVNADEVNITPLFKWDSARSKAGGGVRVDWWVTDQQGAFLGWDEFEDRKSYFSAGYQARTVFKNIEVKTGLGTRQDNDDPFGDVKLFLPFAITAKVFSNDKLDLRFTTGAEVFPSGRPNVLAGVTFTALRF